MKTIAVANAKGGVGKTSIAVNFAVSLAEHGHSVLLVDADLALANVDFVLGLRADRSLADVAAGTAALEEVVIEGPEGVKVIPGGTGDRDLARLEQDGLKALWDQIKSYSSKFDFTVLDTASGIGANPMVFLTSADRVLIVASPEPTSVLDAYSCAKLVFAERPEADVSLLVNMAESLTQGQTVFNRFRAMVGQFVNREVSFAGVVEFDASVHKATKARESYILKCPKSKASRQTDALCEWITDSPTERVDNEAIGLLAKMRTVFSLFKKSEPDPEESVQEEAA